MEFQNVSYEKNGVQSEKPTLLLPVDTILYFEYIKAKKKVKNRDGKYDVSKHIRSIEELLRTKEHGMQGNRRNNPVVFL